jgi:hypothetical protein
MIQVRAVNELYSVMTHSSMQNVMNHIIKTFQKLFQRVAEQYWFDSRIISSTDSAIWFQ